MGNSSEGSAKAAIKQALSNIKEGRLDIRTPSPSRQGQAHRLIGAIPLQEGDLPRHLPQPLLASHYEGFNDIGSEGVRYLSEVPWKNLTTVNLSPPYLR